MSIHKCIITIREKIRGLSIIQSIEKDVKNTIEHPLDNLGYLLCEFVGYVSALYGGFLWLYFTFTGGHKSSIENIKNGDFQALIQLHGELGSRYYSSILFTIFMGLLGIALVAVVAKGLHYRGRVARCILLVLLIICMISMLCAVLFPYCIDYLAQNEQVYKYITEVGIEQVQNTWANLLIVIAVCSFITLCVICFAKKVRHDGQVWLIACLVATAGVPLIISILENILRLIGLGIMAALILAVFWVFTHGDSDAGASPPAKSSGSSAPLRTSAMPSSFSASSRTSTKPCPSSQKIKNTEYVDRGFLGCKVYRMHGVLHDYIEYDNGVGTREICSLDDLRKGKFHIIDKATKRAIQEHEIPWKN